MWDLGGTAAFSYTTKPLIDLVGLIQKTSNGSSWIIWYRYQTVTSRWTWFVLGVIVIDRIHETYLPSTRKRSFLATGHN